jgi:hypothetical protein
MITDRIQLAGLDSYFQDPANPGDINLGVIAPVTIRTAPLNKGKQLEVSGIQLLIEHTDLESLMNFQTTPILRVSVMKEMFAGLFADPYSHRVHNIAGFLDFNEGTLINGKVMEIDGIPTIVSTSKDERIPTPVPTGNECVWTSKVYEMPDPISIDAIAWELATAKLIPPDSFHYSIKIDSKNEAGTVLPVIEFGTPALLLKADAKRTDFISNNTLNNPNNKSIKTFQITFTAKVYEDSYLTERHLPSIGENIGRPLLRAINILEPIKTIYDIHSLTELQGVSNDFFPYGTPGTKIKRVTATLDLNAVMANSLNNDITNNIYEHVILQVNHKFRVLTARLVGEELIKVNM